MFGGVAVVACLPADEDREWVTRRGGRVEVFDVGEGSEES